MLTPGTKVDPVEEVLYGLNAVKILHGYTTQFDCIQDDNVAAVLEALQDCYQFTCLHQVQVREPLTVEKLMYHILIKTLKRVSILGVNPCSDLMLGLTKTILWFQ